MKVLIGICVISFIGIIGTALGEVCAGCPTQKNVDDPELRKYLTKAVSIKNAESNDDQINIVSITKITSQVVAGSKYTYEFLGEGRRSKKQFDCRSVVLLQVWISPEPQVLEHKCTEKASNRQLLGKPKDISQSESNLVKDLAQMGIETLDELDADDNKRVIVRIIEAKKQLVNGIMYNIVVEVKTTMCPEVGVEMKECFNEEVAPKKICKLQIYRSFADESPHNAKVVKSECDTARADRSTLGNSQTNSTHLDKLAHFATKMINNAINSISVKVLVNVFESNHMVENGSHVTSVTIEIADTNCTKRKADINKECVPNGDIRNHLLCTADIIHDENYGSMKLNFNNGLGGFKCKPFSQSNAVNSRVERSVRLSDERIDEFKEFVEDEFNKNSGLAYRQAISNVILVKLQKILHEEFPRALVNLLAEVADTNCPNNDDSIEDTCTYRNQNQAACRFVIWEVEGKSKYIIDSECSPIVPDAELLNVDKSDENLIKFKDFASHFDKTYSSVKELKKRFKIFRANLKKIDYLQKTEQGSATYGATFFADLSRGEFRKNFLGLNKNKKSSSEPQFTQRVAETPNIELPEEYDWRHYNVVTPVKNQGLCGSCWAFSVTGNIEGQYAIKTGNLVSLSEQELVDCDKYDDGCKGGLFDSAYHAIEEMGGLEGESDYPYTGADGNCRFDSSEIRVSITSSVNVSHNETDMAKWLVANGPISIALNANAMQFYMGGVSHPLKFLCSPADLDHGVLLVGYGTHKTWLLHRNLPYWLIKNSWGKHWGHSGYYMLYRGDGTCGVNQMPSSAVL